VLVALLGLLAVNCLLLGVQVERGLFNTLFPLRYLESGLPDSSALLLSGAWFGLLALPLGGFLGDRFGRLRLVLSGMLVSSLAIITVTLAVNTPVFAFSQGLMALGVGLALPNLLTLFLEVFTTHRLLSFAAGSYLSGLVLLAQWSRLGVYFVVRNYSLPAGLVSSLVFVGLVVAAGCALIFGLRKVSAGLEFPPTWLEPGDLQSRRWLLVVFWGAVFAFGLIGALASIIPSSLPAYDMYRVLTDHLNRFARQYEFTLIWAFLLGGLLGDLAAHWASRSGRREFGRASTAVFGMALLCAGLFWLGQSLDELQPDLLGLNGALVILGLGSGFLAPSLLALVAGQARRLRWPLFMGISLAIQQLGNLVGISAVPLLSARFGLAAPAYLGLAAGLLALAGLAAGAAALFRRA
jgi:MFS family permease